MDKYVYQKFLLKCDYEDIKIADFPHYEGNLESVLDYRCDYCLFDVGKTLIRKISVSDIDNQVDTEDDWNQLMKGLKEFEVIVIYDYILDSANPIIQSYREATLKAYLYRLVENNMQVCLTY